MHIFIEAIRIRSQHKQPSLPDLSQYPYPFLNQILWQANI